MTNRLLRRTARPDRTPPTLRATWLATMGSLVVVIVALGVLLLVATGYQRVRFDETTGQLQEATESLVALDRRIAESIVPMTEILYRLGGPEAGLVAEVDYAAATPAIDAAFDRVGAALAGGPGAPEVDAAHRLWAEIDEVVRSSRQDWSDAALNEAFAVGHDPFRASVWDPHDRFQAELGAVRQASARHVGERADALSASLAVVRPFAIGALVLGLLVAVRAARTLSRRVLAPLAEVGRAARQMHEGTEVPLDVDRAAAEVQDLARAVSDGAAAMRTHAALLRTQARTDAMTALPNRSAFSESLHTLLDDEVRGRVAVLFIDLDDFKDVNDTQGHAAGDELLRVVALRLGAVTRGCEVAARLGGDEFAVALDTGQDSAAAVMVAERVQLALGNPVELLGQQVAVGCSIGIALSEPGATSRDGDEILGNADFAMYLAKSQGKGRYELFSPGMHTDVLARMELARDLTGALARDELVLHYQPVLDLPAHQLLGFEALIRWQHPTRGTVAPNDFIGLAEQSGAIVEIGAWVLDQACASLARHHALGLDLTMGVNVSPVQLVAPGYAQGVLATLERHGIEPGHLVLEVTEATAMTSTEVGAAALADLRRQGVHIALDDFGTGYSSLRYLGDLPANVLKIDRSFVSSRTKHHTSTLESIVALAQRLGLFVVAEGVETADDLERLVRFGHIGVQGYHFARPMPEDEALELARRSCMTTLSG